MTIPSDLLLDVDSPDRVAFVLRCAADAYAASAVELEGAWQDNSAGLPWTMIARELNCTAETIERKLRRHYGM